MIAKNLDQIIHSIKSFTADARRNRNEIQLIAVSKYVEISRILEAYKAGQRIFGENRVQEIVEKKDRLPSDIKWHMIGHLQTNKVKSAVNSAHLIHSVDSIRLLIKINETAETINKKQDILIQTNISGESNKYGATLKDAEELLVRSLNMEWVECKGFMTIPPQTDCSVRNPFNI